MALALLETSNSFLYETPNHTGSPERLLLLAILERAILDFVGNDTKEATEAYDWIFADLGEANDIDQDSDPFSFIWLCRELDLTPREVAEMIKSMPKRGTHRIAPWYFSRREEWKH